MIQVGYTLVSKKTPNKSPYDHPTFDLTSVLYAARPDHSSGGWGFAFR